jgi:hypothetical protein
VAGGEVVGTIEHDISGGNQPGQVVRQEFFLHGNDINVGVQRVQGDARCFHLRRANGIRAVENLPLQVGEVDLVRVGERQLADAACGQVDGRRAAKAAGADDQRVRGTQPLLALDPDFGEQDMAAVAK